MGKYEWLLYVALAGLAWGTYVPLIFYGGGELPTSKPGLGGRLMAILCVGIAYFVLAVLIPLGMFLTKQAEWPTMKTTGSRSRAWPASPGRSGALCVVFASPRPPSMPPAPPAAAGDVPPVHRAGHLRPRPSDQHAGEFRVAPEAGCTVALRVELPGWKLWVGIILVGIGAALFSSPRRRRRRPSRPRRSRQSRSRLSHRRSGYPRRS
jgi:hypothetical protein